MRSCSGHRATTCVDWSPKSCSSRRQLAWRGEPSRRPAGGHSPVLRDGRLAIGGRAASVPRRLGEPVRRTAQRPGARTDSRRGRRRAGQPQPRLYSGTWHFGASRGDRRVLPAPLRGVRQPGRRRGHHRVDRRLPARLPRVLRRRRPRRSDEPRLSVLPQHPLCSGLRGRRDTLRTRHAVPADGRDACRGRAPDQGVGARQPGEPDRHRHRTGRVGSNRELVREQRRAAGERRDLPRPDLSGLARHQLRLGDVAGSDRGEQLLEVLRHDRLATRLAAAPSRAATGGGPADRKLLDLPAGAAPVRSRGCLHPAIGGSGRRPSPRIRRQPRQAAARTSRDGAIPIGARRRRLLRLRRHLRLFDELAGLLRAVAGRHRRCDRAGH